MAQNSFPPFAKIPGFIAILLLALTSGCDRAAVPCCVLGLFDPFLGGFRGLILTHLHRLFLDPLAASAAISFISAAQAPLDNSTVRPRASIIGLRVMFLTP
jgi:hypothetical protein